MKKVYVIRNAEISEWTLVEDHQNGYLVRDDGYESGFRTQPKLKPYEDAEMEVTVYYIKAVTDLKEAKEIAEEQVEQISDFYNNFINCVKENYEESMKLKENNIMEKITIKQFGNIFYETWGNWVEIKNGDTLVVRFGKGWRRNFESDVSKLKDSYKIEYLDIEYLDI